MQQEDVRIFVCIGKPVSKVEFCCSRGDDLDLDESDERVVEDSYCRSRLPSAYKEIEDYLTEG